MAKKLCLVLSALSLIPATVFGYGGYYGSGDGSTTFTNGRTTNRSKSNRTGTASSSSRPATAFSSARSGSGTRGFSGGGGRGFGSGGVGSGAAFGSAATPSHTATTTQATSGTTIPTAEGALARSPGMFTLKQPSIQPPTWTTPGGFTGVAMEDSQAQSISGAGLGQYVGPADLAQGQNGSSSSQSGPYNGTLYSNNNSAAGH